MKVLWAVPIIASILILGTLGLAPDIFAGHIGCPPECGSGDGEIVSINPKGNHGTIERTDNGSSDKYQFRIPQDLHEDYLDPEVGDKVCFGIDPIHSRHATNVLSPCGTSGGI